MLCGLSERMNKVLWQAYGGHPDPLSARNNEKSIVSKCIFFYADLIFLRF